jgi:hypothetical protein
MTLSISWWLLALIVGGMAPIWVRAIAERFERRARQRTEHLVASMKRAPTEPDPGSPHGDK